MLLSMGVLRRRELMLGCADLAWSSLVVAPLVVLFWRGVWDVMDEVVPVYPSGHADEPAVDELTRRQKSGLISFFLGLIGRIFLDLVKFHFGEYLYSKKTLTKTLGGLVYAATYAFAGVCFWRGIWFLMELDVGEKEMTLLVVLIGGLIILALSKISRSLIATPLGISLDSHESTFEVASFFLKTPESQGWFIVDILFTNLVVRLLIVLCWWSLWSLEDRFLITNIIGVKDNIVAYDSLLLGYAATILAFIMDKVMLISPKTKQYIYQPYQVLTVLVAFFGSVNVWRGIWSIYDNFLFPGIGKDMNYLLSALVGFVLLSLMLLTNTICNDQICSDLGEGEVISIQYWQRRKIDGDHDEMIPILE